MPRPTLAELERRCQKLDHRRLGNWMARRVGRPLALRVTWLVLPWGVSAHAATLCAWLAALAAAAAFGWGTIVGWLLGAVLLQVWYLLDHVDGQLARYRGAASLDGVQLDYLMHHTVGLLLPLGIGWGLFARSAEPLWLLAGLGWGVGTLLVGLLHDARYKAFVQRLKLVRGELRLVGGGGGRPTPCAPPPRRLVPLAAWVARKSCEGHVVLNVLTLLAAAEWLLADRSLLLARAYATGMAAVALAVAGGSLARSLAKQAAEAEFADWYRPPPGCLLVCRDGWWHVEADAGQAPAMVQASDEAAPDAIVLTGDGENAYRVAPPTAAR